VKSSRFPSERSATSADSSGRCGEMADIGSAGPEANHLLKRRNGATTALDVADLPHLRRHERNRDRAV
jgi:hypothetical protein